jgi:4-carboxymuconolactone decarboxylase
MVNSKNKGGVFGLGKANDAYAAYFIGHSYLKTVLNDGLNICNVTFEPGCRNNWHIHHAAKGGGQILLCTSGEGWYQQWGKPARELHPGDSVYIPSGVKHWHGATKNSWFSHLSIEVPGEETSTEWLEPVNDIYYGGLEK